MNDFNKLIGEDKPTLVDFFATWCGPCRMQAPILEDVKTTVGDKANVIKVDIDQNRELAMQYHVQSVPTLIMFSIHGKRLNRYQRFSLFLRCGCQRLRLRMSRSMGVSLSA